MPGEVWAKFLCGDCGGEFEHAFQNAELWTNTIHVGKNYPIPHGPCFEAYTTQHVSIIIGSRKPRREFALMSRCIATQKPYPGETATP